jgi:hypothetical protein
MAQGKRGIDAISRVSSLTATRHYKSLRGSEFYTDFGLIHHIKATSAFALRIAYRPKQTEKTPSYQARQAHPTGLQGLLPRHYHTGHR